MAQIAFYQQFNGRKKYLERGGLYPNASDAFDDGLDQLAPPTPPSNDVFDARLTTASDDFFSDTRGNDLDLKTFNLEYQAGAGAGPITLSWDLAALPFPDRVTFTMIDDFTGALFTLDMRTVSSLDVSTNVFIQDKLNIEVNMSPAHTTSVPAGQTGQVLDAEGVVVDLTTNASSMAGTLRVTRFEGRAPLNDQSVGSSPVTAPDGQPIILDRVSPNRFWRVVAEDLVDVTYTICLDISGLGGVSNPNRLVVVHRGNGDQVWVPQSSTLETPGGVDHICAAGLTGFSQFGIGSNGGESVLPVELVVFEALLDGDAVELRWETASETNNAGFEVEHRTGGDYEVLAFVEGHGTTLEAQVYTYRVTGLAPGRHEFQLKQVDFDGTFEYSPKVEVQVEVRGAYYLSGAYPNPFKGEAQFTLTVARSQGVVVEVYDVRGRRVGVLHEGVLQEGEVYRFRLEESDLPSGLYLYRVVGDYFVGIGQVTLVR